MCDKFLVYVYIYHILGFFPALTLKFSSLDYIYDLCVVFSASQQIILMASDLSAIV